MTLDTYPCISYTGLAPGKSPGRSRRDEMNGVVIVSAAAPEPWMATARKVKAGPQAVLRARPIRPVPDPLATAPRPVGWTYTAMSGWTSVAVLRKAA